ncbi:MAG: hypothetical protein R3F11_23070 [Verrucomicrobiales bacterium]
MVVVKARRTRLQATTTNSPWSVPDENAKFPTTYCRTFHVDLGADCASWTLRLRRDDGAAVYINGTEVARDTPPPVPGRRRLAAGNVADEGAGQLSDFFARLARTRSPPKSTAPTPRAATWSFDLSLVASVPHQLAW